MAKPGPILYRDNAKGDGGNATQQRVQVASSEAILRRYEADRVTSPLARIFEFANGWHDHVDAALVVGDAASLDVCRALLGTLCQPLHNEATRASRGSKPRMYFLGDRLDSELARGMLDRLACREDVPPAARENWLLVGLASDELSPVVIENFRWCYRQLPNLGQANRSTWMIAGPRGHEMLDALQLANTSSHPSWVHDSVDASVDCNVFCTMTLLPAAVAGLDCVQWMEGAAAANRMAGEADGKNQPAFALASLQASSHARRRRLVAGDAALIGWGDWLDRRWQVIQAANGSNHPDGFDSGHDEELEHHVVARRSRTDSIEFETRNWTQLKLQQSEERFEASKSPASFISLPFIDPFFLGQWLQWIQLADHLNSVAIGSPGISDIG
ncbi:MAG: hypothetical protein AAF958_00535 [Planctomycetota bacterium]